MTKKIFQITSLMLVLAIVSGSVLAQDDSVATATDFTGRPTLWIAIIIGFATTAVTLFYANRLKGGIVGLALNLFGAGMFFVVLGFLAVVVNWAGAPAQELTHDAVFILGYILMLVGALKLREIA